MRVLYIYIVFSLYIQSKVESYLATPALVATRAPTTHSWRNNNPPARNNHSAESARGPAALRSPIPTRNTRTSITPVARNPSADPIPTHTRISTTPVAWSVLAFTRYRRSQYCTVCGVWHTQEGSGGVRISSISRAIVLQWCE